MNCYAYAGADVICYFEDSKGRIQVLTTDGIYEDCEVGKSKKWIRENLRHFSKKQLENYINNHSNSYFPWKGIIAQYFKEEKKEKKEKKKKKEKKMVEFDTNKKVGAEGPDSSKHRTDADRDYYWPLGEIELEEVQL